MKIIIFAVSVWLLVVLAFPTMAVHARIITPASPGVDSHTDSGHSHESDKSTVVLRRITAPTAARQTIRTVTPPTPRIVYPAYNQTLTSFPRQLTITWQYDSTYRHRIEITCDYCKSMSVWGGTADTYTIDRYTNSYSVIVPGDNRYRVRVKAINELGVEGAWSDYTYYSFRT